MENDLRLNLIRCGETYAAARGISLATVARQAAGDWRFFERLRIGEKTFTARKYDEVIGWLSTNWPANTDWPASIARPEPVAVAS
jgi:hypothetical protein